MLKFFEVAEPSNFALFRVFLLSSISVIYYLSSGLIKIKKEFGLFLGVIFFRFIFVAVPIFVSEVFFIQPISLFLKDLFECLHLNQTVVQMVLFFYQFALYFLAVKTIEWKTEVISPNKTYTLSYSVVNSVVSTLVYLAYSFMVIILLAILNLAFS